MNIYIVYEDRNGIDDVIVGWIFKIHFGKDGELFKLSCTYGCSSLVYELPCLALAPIGMR